MPSDVDIAHRATSGRRGPDAALVKTSLDAHADRITAQEAARAAEARISSLTAGTSIHTTATETVTKTVTVPLSRLAAGTRVKVFCRTAVTSVSATPTIRTALRLVDASGQSLCDSGAVTADADHVGYATAEILIHGAPGATTRIYYSGHAQQHETAPVFSQGVVAEQDLSAGLVVCCTLKWSASHADNIAAGTELSYELVQPTAA